MPSGLDEITRKETVAWNPQIQERTLLRKLLNSFYLPTDHRPRRWAGPGERPEEVSVGAGRALSVDRWALAPPQRQREG